MALGWVTSVSSILAVTFVLFSDVMFTPLGGYADQRFLLILMSSLLVSGAVVHLLFYSPVRLVPLSIALLPVSFLSLAFLLSATPFSGQLYVWVEPGFYALYFFTFVSVGLSLSLSFSVTSYINLLVTVIAISCFFYGMMSVNVYIFLLHDNNASLVSYLPWGFVNIRYWSHVATWLIPLLPLAVLVSPLRRYHGWKILVAISGGVWWWLVILSTSRGSALGVIFGMCLVFALLGRPSLPWVKLSLQYLIVGIFFWFLFSVAVPTLVFEDLQVRSIKTHTSGRIPLFAEAWVMTLQNFPAGMGPQSWLTHEPMTDTYLGGKKFGHPHNMYLMWAAEYGWVLICFLVILAFQAVRYFWSCRKDIRNQENCEYVLLLAGLTASVSAALLHAGVSAVFMAPGSMLVGLFVLIGFWAFIQPSALAVKTWTSRRFTTQYKITGILIVGVFVIAWAAWFRQVCIYYENMRLDESFYQEHIGGGALPRFWFHGSFPRPLPQMPPKVDG